MSLQLFNGLGAWVGPGLLRRSNFHWTIPSVTAAAAVMTSRSVHIDQNADVASTVLATYTGNQSRK